jgi:phosphoenolpyruvate carboxykinase (ATP)
VSRAPCSLSQSLERKTVVILGTEYAGEMKKSIFYAMNYDMPDQGVFPMHCSANIDREDPTNVALFFGLSGTGQDHAVGRPRPRSSATTSTGGGPAASSTSRAAATPSASSSADEGEPQIWNAIRFGSVLENTVIDERTRVPDYDDGSITENTRVTYPVDFIPGARSPPWAGTPRTSSS